MMPWAVLGIFIFFLVVSYIVLQGTRAALAWRKAAAAGDVKVIRDIAEDALNSWRSGRRPKAVAPDVWRGIQSAQLIAVAADGVRVSCQAQSEYRMLEGRWLEVRNALQEGISIAAKAAEMLLYELPNFRPQLIQLDVYTSFRQGEDLSSNLCILSLQATRDQARTVDWDEWTAEEIVDALDARYRLGERGQPLPIDVEPWPADEPQEATAQ